LSKAKNRARAKKFIFRNGQRIPRQQWDKHQKELKELYEEQERKVEDERLAAINLVRGGQRILTREDIMKHSRPVKGVRQ